MEFLRNFVLAEVTLQNGRLLKNSCLSDFSLHTLSVSFRFVLQNNVSTQTNASFVS